MKKIFFIILLFFIIPFNVFANENVNIYVFHNYNCKYCQKALNYYNELIKKDSSIHLFDYELLEDYHAYNRNIYNTVTSLLNIKEKSVPLTIIGNDYIIGFSPTIQEKIDNLITYYKENDYQDKVGFNIGIVDENNNIIEDNILKDYHIKTIFGNINLNNRSLTITTIITSLIDGINLYSLLGIILLITIIYKCNSKDYWILGLSFLFWYAFIYFIHLMAWININDYLSDVLLIKLLTIIPLIFISIISLYRYIKNINKENNNQSLLLPITGVILLSTFISLLNIMNSTNISILYNEILNGYHLTGNSYTRYMLLYLFFFIFINLIILIIAKILINKQVFIKFKKYSLLIKSILLMIISIIIFIL